MPIFMAFSNEKFARHRLAAGEGRKERRAFDFWQAGMCHAKVATGLPFCKKANNTFSGCSSQRTKNLSPTKPVRQRHSGACAPERVKCGVFEGNHVYHLETLRYSRCNHRTRCPFPAR
jgi:hypothetical protein